MMRFVVQIVVFLVFHTVGAQGLAIQGFLQGFDDGTQVELMDLEAMELLGTKQVKEGGFQVSSAEKLDFPRTVRLIIGGGTEKTSNVYLFVENGEFITIHSQFDNFDENLKVENSKYYAAQQDFDGLTKELYDKRNELMEEYMQRYYGKPEEEAMSESYWGKSGSIGKIDSEVNTLNEAYLLENANSYFSLSYIVRSFSRIEKPVLKEMYEKLDAPLKSSKYGVFLKAFIDSPQMEEGMDYYDFSFDTVNGEKQNLSSYFDGRYVLVDFSTLYCGASQMSRAGLEKLSSNNQDKIHVLTYYIDSDEEGFKAYSSSKLANWNVIRNHDGRMNDILAHYMIAGTPTYFFFSPEGKLLKKWSGYGEDTVTLVEGYME